MTKILWVLFLAVWSSGVFELDLPIFKNRLGISLFNLTSFLFVVLWAMIFLVRPRFRSFGLLIRHYKVLVLFYVIYWAISLLGSTTVFAEGRHLSLLNIWYSIVFIVSLEFLLYLSPDQRRKLWIAVGRTVLIMFALVSIFGLARGSAVVDSSLGSTRYTISVFRDYNGFTQYCIIAWLLAVSAGQANWTPNARRLGIYFMGLLFLIGMGMSCGSRRSALLFFPLGLLIPYYLVSRRRGNIGALRAIRTGVLGLSAGLVIVTILRFSGIEVGTNFANQFERYFERGISVFTTGSTGVERFELWDSSLNVIGGYSSTELLLGRGTRSFLYEPQMETKDGRPNWPHNFVLSALMEGGLVKVAILLIFVALWLISVVVFSRNQPFWMALFVLIGAAYWMTSVSMSGQEFFNTRVFLMQFLFQAGFTTSVATAASRQPVNPPVPSPPPRRALPY